MSAVVDVAPPVIEFTGVSRVYPGPPEVPALAGVDLTIDRAEYVAIVGPSGSGKSTLLNVVGLLDRATAGRYRLDGLDVGDLRERDRAALRGGRVGFVFQSFHLLAHRTVAENVMLAQVYNGVARRRRLPEALRVLELVGLRHLAHSLPSTMSGGERQRVAVARALVNSPSLLLCDEPTGSLDSANSSRLLDLFDRLTDEGNTIVVITHSDEVAQRVGRVITIRDGAIIEDRTR
jgi:putative ABC transport system ATP-binding protein